MKINLQLFADDAPTLTTGIPIDSSAIIKSESTVGDSSVKVDLTEVKLSSPVIAIVAMTDDQLKNMSDEDLAKLKDDFVSTAQLEKQRIVQVIAEKKAEAESKLAEEKAKIVVEEAKVKAEIPVIIKEVYSNKLLWIVIVLELVNVISRVIGF